jgi:histidine triad (HIT) family protein
MADCIFCKMVSGEIKPDTVYEDEHVLAFRDLNPQAPTHVLIVPKKHIATINDVSAEDAHLVGKMYLAAQEVAKTDDVDQRGYRTVMNCNAEAGQSVYHLHLHVLGGRPMDWPPG